MLKRRTYINFILLSIGIILFGFQNCAQDVNFQSSESPSTLESNGDLDNPGDNPIDNPGDTPIDNPTDYSDDNPKDNPTDYSDDNPKDDPTDYPDDNPKDDPTDYPDDNPSDNPQVCNPLMPTEVCDNLTPDAGLSGNLYYLMPEQKSLFNNSLRNARLEDYRTFGTQVDANIIMTSIDIAPRSWDSGFYLDENTPASDLNGDKLLEWFHLDLSGKISLPAGDYQVATLSDDGIKVTLNNQSIINNDSIHSPSWDCSNQVVSFSEDESKTIRVEYFQGPRVDIALQLFVRKVVDGDTKCDRNAESGFYIIPNEALSH